jgi:hypothetical protein
MRAEHAGSAESPVDSTCRVTGGPAPTGSPPPTCHPAQAAAGRFFYGLIKPHCDNTLPALHAFQAIGPPAPGAENGHENQGQASCIDRLLLQTPRSSAWRTVPDTNRIPSRPLPVPHLCARAHIMALHRTFRPGPAPER